MSEVAYRDLLALLSAHLKQASSSEDFVRLRDAREQVCSRYGAVFRPDRLDRLTAAEFKSFLDFKNNQHWSGLHRIGGKAVKQMPGLRVALAQLLDESQPLARRLEAALRHPGLGKGIATAILLVVFPEKYGVWNNRSEKVLKKLGLWPAGNKSPGDIYTAVNSLLNEIANDLGIDLWTLDGLWWHIDRSEDGDLGRLPTLLQEVLDLQSEFSDRATPAMVRRGELIRDEIAEVLRGSVAALPGHTGLQVQGRDGTGRKTRVPWVRVYDPAHSPRATTGWYVVFLFSADGRNIYLSLNQGTTEFKNGSFVPRKKEDLIDRAEHARRLIGEIPGTLLAIDLADPGGLGDGYAVGNVCAFCYEGNAIPPQDAIREDLRVLLEQLAKLSAEHQAADGQRAAFLLVWNPTLYPWQELARIASELPAE
jgi:hypothetical protein